MTPTYQPMNDYASGTIEQAALAPIVAAERVSALVQPTGIQPAHYRSLTGQTRVPQEQIEIVQQVEIADPLEVVSSVSGDEPYDYFAQ